MRTGLKRNTVCLKEHDVQWEHTAAQTIATLERILGSLALDIQHVGSTSVRGIVAKPIIDIAIGAKEVDSILRKNEELEENGIIFAHKEATGQLLYVMGDIPNDILTHHIHVVAYGSMNWINYINFRDYLNHDQVLARKYSELKKALCGQYADNRGKYTEGKHGLIGEILQKAQAWRAEQSWR